MMDLTVICGDAQVPVIISKENWKHIPFFLSMMESNMVEAKGQTVNKPDVSNQTMTAIIVILKCSKQLTAKEMRVIIKAQRAIYKNKKVYGYSLDYHFKNKTEYMTKIGYYLLSSYLIDSIEKELNNCVTSIDEIDEIIRVAEMFCMTSFHLKLITGYKKRFIKRQEDEKIISDLEKSFEMRISDLEKKS